MKFNGTNWVNVGIADFSAKETDYTSLAFSPSGQPYVAYEDGGNLFKATVMRFDGINWVNVGIAGFSAGEANFTSLAINASGIPYLAYMDYWNSNKATVMKYDFPNGIIEPQESTLSLYPNPVINKVTIETSTIPPSSQLSISNLSGQELITRQIIEPKTQLDVSSLPRGVYFVRIANDKAVSVGKFIKE
jgi:hypothetical protein